MLRFLELVILENLLSKILVSYETGQQGKILSQTRVLTALFPGQEK